MKNKGYLLRNAKIIITENIPNKILLFSKIIVLRKMGFTVEEIKRIQNNDLPFKESISNVQQRLENEIEQLNGSLFLVKEISKKYASFDAIDIIKQWDAINQSEKSGEKFTDICKDFLELELTCFDFMWKYVFFMILRNRENVMVQSSPASYCCYFAFCVGSEKSLSGLVFYIHF